MDPSDAGGRTAAVDAASGADATKINLRAAAHRLDAAPLLSGCTCFTCRMHSRAYLHHLLNTHEILAATLLDMCATPSTTPPFAIVSALLLTICPTFRILSQPQLAPHAKAV